MSKSQVRRLETQFDFSSIPEPYGTRIITLTEELKLNRISVQFYRIAMANIKSEIEMNELKDDIESKAKWQNALDITKAIAEKAISSFL